MPPDAFDLFAQQHILFQSIVLALQQRSLRGDLGVRSAQRLILRPALCDILENPYRHPLMASNMKALTGNQGDEFCAVFSGELPFDMCILVSPQQRPNDFAKGPIVLGRLKHDGPWLPDKAFHGTPKVLGDAPVGPQNDAVCGVDNAIRGVLEDDLLLFQKFLALGDVVDPGHQVAAINEIQ